MDSVTVFNGRKPTVEPQLPPPTDDDDDDDSDTPLADTDAPELTLSQLKRIRRERLAVSIANLMVDTFITAKVPSRYFPSCVVFKNLITQVQSLVIAHEL